VSPSEAKGTHEYTSSFVGASLLRRGQDDKAGTIRIQHYLLPFQLAPGTKIPLFVNMPENLRKHPGVCYTSCSISSSTEMLLTWAGSRAALSIIGLEFSSRSMAKGSDCYLRFGYLIVL
jgi:hypothetical protein